MIHSISQMHHPNLNLFLPVLWLTAAITWADIRPSEVLVLVNTLNPESRLVGQVYQKARRIPEANMLKLEVPDRESITRETYNKSIAVPVREYLHKKENFQIQYIVTTKGMPRRITHTPGLSSARTKTGFNYNGASLESELMNVLFEYSSFSGWVKRTARINSLDEKRELIVTRMDGPGVVQIELNLKEALGHEKLGARGTVCFEIEENLDKDPGKIPYLKSMDKLQYYYENHTKELKYFFRDKFGLPDYAGIDSNLIVVNLYQDNQSECNLGKGGSGLAISGNRKTIPGSGRVFGAGYYFEMVGPTYISAWPKPHEFIALLFSGQYSMGEILNQVLPHSSWQLTYIGDPMYTPFEVNPQFELDMMEAIMGSKEPDGKVK